MAHIILRVDLADDDECVVDYGMTEEAASLLDYASGWDTSVRYSIVEFSGPDDPRVCHRCGCAPHGDAPCSTCDHPLCAEVAVPIPSQGTRTPAT